MAKVPMPDCATLLISSPEASLFVASRTPDDVALPHVKFFDNKDPQTLVTTLARSILSIEVTPKPLKLYSALISRNHKSPHNWVFRVELLPQEMQTARLLATPECPSPEWVPGEELKSQEQYWTELIGADLGGLGAMTQLTPSTFEVMSYENSEEDVWYLLKTAKLGAKRQLDLLETFLASSWPEISVTAAQFVALGLSFKQYVNDEDFWARLFLAADLDGRRRRSFREFVLALAVCDPVPFHGGPVMQLRSSYIFRFYDRNRKGYWDLSDVTDACRDAVLSRNEPLGEVELGSKVEEAYRVLELPLGSQVSQSAFSSVGMNFEGVSRLLRFKFPAPEPLKFAPFVLQTSNGGRSIAIASFEEEKFVSTSSVQAFQAQPAPKDSELLSQAEQPAAEVIACLVTFGSARFKPVESETYVKKRPYSWTNMSLNSFGESLIKICSLLSSRLATGPRCLEVPSPVYIFGDLHGDFKTLMTLERKFWHFSPLFLPLNLLFLGDFVDRGLFGVEVVAYLFAYKSLNFDRISLVRGNHETRELHRQYTFQKECSEKFGSVLGRKVFEAINSVFDCLPLAAVVDKRLFCVHGGIPHFDLAAPGRIMEALEAIPVPLKEPKLESQLAQNIIWNDPLPDLSSNDEFLTSFATQNPLFIPNYKRQVGNFFSQQALDIFLQSNGFEMVIRAHEMQPEGFSVQMQGKLITVFTTEPYCRINNRAAGILVDSDQIKVFVMGGLKSEEDLANGASCSYAVPSKG